ncbi:uncharacterized protein TRAVEDRAFT_43816 [Trametes versicolor FP-101664 SS1]|uniref:uncharacterized protein n=1 Tax=Trametes versicolor (strain FP-101664) TaxID=717944 RepID=UPI0004623A52|nr:uncharacterized protein TRAVEDRAFT_43816 [Trametes versicolor FP-101664 SS1]EIW63530.1 hypothetical protein TRAVEDRAFT_43816 [Trametes versicolor FP-101664 SS1]
MDIGGLHRRRQTYAVDAAHVVSQLRHTRAGLVASHSCSVHTSRFEASRRAHIVNAYPAVPQYPLRANEAEYYVWFASIGPAAEPALDAPTRPDTCCESSPERSLVLTVRSPRRHELQKGVRTQRITRKTVRTLDFLAANIIA